MADEHGQNVEALLRLPWTIRVSRNEDDGYFIARVAELPDVLATGKTDAELEADLWASLRASLEAYLHFGDPVPRPNRSAGVSPIESRIERRGTIQMIADGDAWAGPGGARTSSSAAAVEFAV